MTFDPFPAEYELIGLFECEPTLLDEGIPWAYNHLTFESIRGADRLHCVMEPGHHALSFSWTRDGHEHLALKCGWVEGIEVDMGPKREFMRLHFRASSGLRPLELQLKPWIRCSITNVIEP